MENRILSRRKTSHFNSLLYSILTKLLSIKGYIIFLCCNSVTLSRALNRIASKSYPKQAVPEEVLYYNRQKASRTVIVILTGSLIINLISVYLLVKLSIFPLFIIRVFELYLLVALLSALYYMPYSFKCYGFTLNRLRFNVIIGLSIGVPGFLIALGIAPFCTDFEGIRLDFFYVFGKILFLLYYLFSAIVQEAVVKGFLQSYFISILSKFKSKKLLSVFICSIVFAQFHIAFGIPVVIAIFTFSFITGLIYEKSRSLVGVVIIHYLCGLGMFLFAKY